MKKFLAIILTVITALLLVSCVFLNRSALGSITGNKEISRGVIEGSVYKNEYLGFEFTKPESWVYSTDEEIAALVNLSVDTMLGDKFKDALENNPAVYDMMVVDSITRTNIGICYENLSKSFSSNITEQQYIDALKKQLSNLSSMTVEFPESYETAKLGQTEFTKVVCTSSTQGLSMKQIYYIKKLDGFMAVIVATVPSGYSVEQIEAMFK